MNTKRLLQPQILIAILLSLILAGVVLFANRSSDGPNTGVLSVEAIGIVITQKGTCAEVGQPNPFLRTINRPGVVCTHGVVLGRKGECVTFGENNFTPRFTDPKQAHMSLCKSHGLHASS
ncbi:hypothetical protein [Ferrimicrobium acidiphilum]|uniref:hypothetical protein n=1 Tax=Ferrimicrobium acidiphilum TaxID=121039 RepID=UPI0023F3AFA3|nr:hypothetical protein [Ferrimicrobium acidiphilum]